MKRFLGLLEEDLKSKLWLVVANWYVFGMFCLILATKMTIPCGGGKKPLYRAGEHFLFCGNGADGDRDGALFLPLPVFRKKE